MALLLLLNAAGLFKYLAHPAGLQTCFLCVHKRLPAVQQKCALDRTASSDCVLLPKKNDRRPAGGIYLGLIASHPRSQRINDGQIPVATDGHHRVGGNENGNGLRKADDAAHDGAERPVEQNKSRDECEGDAEEGHQDVTSGHVDDEEIGDGPFSDAGEHYGAHDHVAHQGQHKHQTVQTVDDGLKEGRRDEGIILSGSGHRRHVHPTRKRGD